MKLPIDPDMDFTGVPIHLHQGLLRYLHDGVPPGNFLQAVIRNDLSDAILRADDECLGSIKGIVGFFNMEMPAPSWGSQAAMDKWCKQQQGQ